MTAVADSEILNFYNQRSILITGATGFLGKILVEKLLRSVRGVRNIFLLIRPQNGLDANQRLEIFLRSQLFENIRKQCPDVLTKLIPITGDVTEENLGISEHDRQRLIDEVSVVFHCAATIKFDETLRVSVNLNVAGTQRLLSLCRQMRNIAAFVHTSTAYANCNRTHILESVYDPPVNPQNLIDSLKWMNDSMASSLTSQLVDKRPNTYTYTKALAEYVVKEESHNVPAIIVRPSIIGAVLREPIPGWVDNLNGPNGIFAAVGKGLLRCMYGDYNATADLVPVDVVSNLLIVSAWHRASPDCESCPVINCCSGRLNTLKWRTIVDSFRHFETYPCDGVYRVLNPRFTMQKLWRDLNVWVDHFMPAYIIDAVCRLLGKKPRLTQLYGKIFKAVSTLEYFTTREWDFQSKVMVDLWNDLTVDDRKMFNFDLREIDWEKYLYVYILGVKKFLLKEDLSNVRAARKQYHRLQIWTSIFNITISVFILRVFNRRCKVFDRVWFYLLSFAVTLFQLKPVIRYNVSADSSICTKPASVLIEGGMN